MESNSEFVYRLVRTAYQMLLSRGYSPATARTLAAHAVYDILAADAPHLIDAFLSEEDDAQGRDGADPLL
ncbi:hypothetical protein [Nocardiopsis synnemataformans]|uniref:hypothetical protein n=1 Tax=Nocardiopsis synnemataformans TaxID=61305 RepID=UPI003EC03DE5